MRTFLQKTFSLIPAICLFSSQIIAEEAKKYPTITAAFGERDLRLSCPASPDSFHSVYWLPETENGKVRVVGSGAIYDNKKHRYLASTGQLLLKDVTEEDAGFYKCLVISKSRTTSIIDAAGLYLVVKRNYASYWEKELKENITRSGVAVGLVGGTMIAACLVYSCRHKGSKNKDGTNFNHPSRGHYEVSSPAELGTSPETTKSSDQASQSAGEEESEPAPAVTVFTNHSINIGVNTDPTEVKPVPPGSTIIYISPTH